MQVYVNNIVKDPENPKYRKIRISKWKINTLSNIFVKRWLKTVVVGENMWATEVRRYPAVISSKKPQEAQTDFATVCILDKVYGKIKRFVLRQNNARNIYT